jgi:PleD family two-component response regulator
LAADVLLLSPKVIAHIVLKGDCLSIALYVFIIELDLGGNMNTNKIRVYILSKQPLLRNGLEYALSVMEDIEISGSTEFSEDVLSTLDNNPPDVAVVDIDDPNGNGLTITRRLKQSLPLVSLHYF